MHFTRLRLQGFKSFVEPTDIEIQPGMTGIVGPNGCGKSNLVEALRWVMGENSAKRMRGSEMDDVIFAGTATRPSRNLAEVMLEMDNSGRTAMAEFNNADSLQVARRIERGNGSDYTVNGKPVRQKDVQWLFADQATGAHSTNLVGQGQIDALIRAKPQDRRQILEEASGTAGLHARRHEAELKLKGAEVNLTRLDDVLKAHDTQLRSLRTQMRQASRYKNLAEHIRRTEAALLHLRWVEAEQNAEAMRLALQTAESRVNELMIVVTQETTARTEIAAELPGLRQLEATAAAVVQKLVLAREQIEAESRRVANEVEGQEKLLAHIGSDREREEARQADGETATIRLKEEQAQLEAQTAVIVEQLPKAGEGLASITESVDQLDAVLAQLMESVASSEARKNALQQELTSLTARQEHLSQKRQQLDAQRASIASEAASRPDLAFASALVDASEIELTRRREQAETADSSRREAEQLQSHARDVAQDTQTRVTRLNAEVEAIMALFQNQEEAADQVIDLINVAPGLENALAVALGDALTASLKTESAMHWRALPPLEDSASLPEGVSPIAKHIDAPSALARSLSQIGVVEDAAAGEAVAPSLKAGQIIVSRDGWAWRWDGFTVTPQGKTATAIRLEQRNRLAPLREEIGTAEAEAHKAHQTLEEATAFFTERQANDKQSREALQAAYAALGDARNTFMQQEKASTAITAKLASVDEALQAVHADLQHGRERASGIEDERKTLPDIDALRASTVETRTLLAEQRGKQAEAQNERDRLTREQSYVESRLKAVTSETEAWQSRLTNAAQQIASLMERATVVERNLEQLRARPAELAASHAQLLTELSDAEQRRKEAADRLIEAEQRLAAIEQKLKHDEAALGSAREERVRSEGAVHVAAEQFNALRERMQEKLSCTPEELPGIAAFEGEMPSLIELEQVLGRYVRERENMGPVNLRAETEADTLQGEVDKLTSEKDDLVAAIAKLRQGITQLNREARERLDNAFTLVNERFQVLFKRLFNGGRAHLELIDNDDPLNAGLEIFASPPGKKMQILSLLSGGERTLTALALLFAVFQTNPSPICVLDEAEAALDESNIDRFCGLVEDIARETGTRFLVITHQRLTMARMDRLYGVTMGELGVSQLVSVDLAGAVALRDGEEVPDTGKAEAALEEVRAA